MKRALIVLIVLLALVGAIGAGVFFYVRSSGDELVRSAIEVYGSELTGTAVTVKSVKFTLADGHGVIRGVRVANPTGFSSEALFSLEEIEVGIDVASLLESPIVVDKVRIVAPKVRYEMGKDGKANVDVVRANATRGGSSQASGSDEGTDVLLRIRTFEFLEGHVAADASAVNPGQLEAVIPPVRLRNLGGKNGAPPEEIGKIVVVGFTKAIGRVVATTGADALIDQHIGGAEGEAAKKALRSFLK